MDSEPIYLYLHVPFCRSLCRYCDFTRTVYQPDLSDTYLTALDTECRLRFPNRVRVRTFFAGGGTPTALSTEQLERLGKTLHLHFDFSSAEEMTVEANPTSADRERFHVMRGWGADRISIGVQSARDDVLRTLGRTHTKDDAYRAVTCAREAGFRNISVDLIFGAPGTKPADIEADAQFVQSLSSEHVALYGLTYEEGTPLETDRRSGRITPVEETTERDMFQRWILRLKAAGYIHYEVSNFARPGFMCRHNLNYWANGSYVGLGPGAVSHEQGKRWGNEKDPAKYARRLAAGELPKAWTERLEGVAKAAETMMLALRRIDDGVDLIGFAERTGFDARAVWASELETLVRDGLVYLERDRLRLSETGFYMLDEVTERLMVSPA